MNTQTSRRPKSGQTLRTRFGVRIRGRTVENRAESRTGWRWPSGPANASLIALFAGLLVLQLPLSMWHDEAFTYINWINGWAPGDLLGPYHSNNHRLFTLLAVAAGRLGGHSDMVLRLPSVIPAVLGLAVTAHAAQRHSIFRHPSLPVAMFASSPIVLYWASQARGYGLVLLAASLLASGALSAHFLGINRSAVVQISAAAVIGVWTLPHFLLLWALTAAVLVVQQRKRIRTERLLLVAPIAAAVVLFAYLPTISSLLARIRSSGPARNPSLSASDALWGHFRFLVIGTLDGAGAISPGQGSVRVVVGVLATIYAIALLSLLLRDRGLLVLLVAPGHGFFIVAWVLGWQFTDRNLLFLLPSFVLTFGLCNLSGLSLSSRRAREARGAIQGVERAIAAAVVALIVILPMHAAIVAIGWSQRPIEAFKDAAAIVESSQATTVVTDSLRAPGIQRYLPQVVRARDEAQARELACETEAPFAFINHNYRRAWSAPTDCLAERGGVAFNLEQRRRGSIQVWIVPESGG